MKNNVQKNIYLDKPILKFPWHLHLLALINIVHLYNTHTHTAPYIIIVIILLHLKSDLTLLSRCLHRILHHTNKACLTLHRRTGTLVLRCWQKWLASIQNYDKTVTVVKCQWLNIELNRLNKIFSYLFLCGANCPEEEIRLFILIWNDRFIRHVSIGKGDKLWLFCLFDG